LEEKLALYQTNLAQLRGEHTQTRQMPDLDFFLFGMGDRPKMYYKNGRLKDALTGVVLRKWQVKKEVIVPSEYTVSLETQDGQQIKIIENENGVYLFNGQKITVLSESQLNLPSFEGHPYAPVLRVLHHEVLINIHNGLPVPNFIVYKKPWFRDAALMAMVLKQTSNLHLIKDWILSIRDPFDRNNHGISEADNLGQVLYLVSLVSDTSHPVVQTVLDSSKLFTKENYLEGKTDYALHPVFQTKWMKYGLKSLGLPDHYTIPAVYDSYSSLFWWDYKDQHVSGNRFDEGNSHNYPYLVWAEDHFYGEKRGIVTSQEYPLSWEAQASDANYAALKVLDQGLVNQKLSPAHTWHASEMFLLLLEAKSKK
jgi:hypothetical protein